MKKNKELEEHFREFKKNAVESQKAQALFSIYKVSNLYHLIKDPIANKLLKKVLEKRIGGKNIPKVITRFMHNEGGIYKTKAYIICNKIKKIKGSKILIPGCGFGRNIIQLLSFYPKEIIAFDLYEYPEEWEFLKNYAEEMGIKLKFMKDDMSEVLKKYKLYFDFIISDALLEHVKDLDSMIESSYVVLKGGGIFYAGFGPLWFGPSGDHIHWGENRIFDHLLLSKKNYLRNIKMRQSEENIDSFTLINENLFSYKRVGEYFKSFKANDFFPIKIFSKISTESLKTLKNRKIAENLDKKNIPSFDRYCPGLYVWLRKK